jgi:Fe-S cluster biogenesis protein NfuA
MSRAPAAARDDGGMHITCPRCAGAVEVRYYGPCDECRTTLRRSLGNEARTVEREAFEPAMHVTPNAVALKDD